MTSEIRCLRCEKVITSALADGGALDSPSDGVSFDGGWNFGSTLYDAAMPGKDGYGIYVTVVICDECLKWAVTSGLAVERRSKDYLLPGASVEL